MDECHHPTIQNLLVYHFISSLCRLQVRGPLNPSDVVTSRLAIHVTDSECLRLCHSGDSFGDVVTFALAVFPPLASREVAVDFGDGATWTLVAANVTDRPWENAGVPSWAAECRAGGGEREGSGLEMIRFEKRYAVTVHGVDVMVSATMIVCDAPCSDIVKLILPPQVLCVLCLHYL